MDAAHTTSKGSVVSIRSVSTQRSDADAAEDARLLAPRSEDVFESTSSFRRAIEERQLRSLFLAEGV